MKKDSRSEKTGVDQKKFSDSVDLLSFLNDAGNGRKSVSARKSVPVRESDNGYNGLCGIYFSVSKSAHMPPDQAGNDSGGTKSQQCVMERTVYIESTFDAIDDLRTVGKKND